MGCLGVQPPQDLTNGCPCPLMVLVGHTRFDQIVRNFHRTFADFRTMSIQYASCDKKKWLIVDFVSQKA